MQKTREQWRLARSAAIVSALLLLTTVPIGLAQDAESESTDPPTAMELEILRLEQEKSIATLEKEIVEAEKAKLAAQLPDSDTKGKSGEVTIGDKAGYFGELLAYRTLDDAAAAIAADLADELKGRTVIVTTRFDLNERAAMRDVAQARIEDTIAALKQVRKDYNDGNPESLGVAAMAVSSLLGSASDIAGMFRVDREIKAREVELAERALVATVARAISEHAKTVRLPAHDLATTAKTTTLLSQMLDERRETRALQNEARVKILPILKQIAELEGKLAKAKADLKKETDPIKKKKLEEQILELSEQIALLKSGPYKLWQTVDARFEATIKSATDLATALTERKDDKASILERLREVDLITDGDARTLFIESPSHGSEVHVTKSMWSSGRVAYVGGSVVAYFLIDGTGAYLKSGTVAGHQADAFRGAPDELGR